MARKSSDGFGILIVLGVIAVVLKSIPTEAWVFIGGVVVAALIFWGIQGYRKASPANSMPMNEDYQTVESAVDQGVRQQPRTMLKSSDDEAFVTITIGTSDGDYSYRIDDSPAQIGQDARWAPKDEAVEVAGTRISCGMLYFGSGPKRGTASAEPGLIDPKLSVAKGPVDTSERLTNYWPSYSEITPKARRAYLDWLASGKCDPETNIGYIFLYFYGLERRALVDGEADSVAKAEIPAIRAEVIRLVAIYGENNSFRRYASQFLNFLDGTEAPQPAYTSAPPKVRFNSCEVPLAIKVGLGQMAVDGVSVPGTWALAWAQSDPNIYKRTPVTRCPDQFEALFLARYAERFGDGFKIRRNKTRLRCEYQPASSGFAGRVFKRDAGGVPDVTVLKTPTEDIQKLVDECTNELDSYSRVLGRNPALKGSLEASLQLPVQLWPVELRNELGDLKSRVGSGMLVISFGELSGRLRSAGALARTKVVALANALEELHLGIEPDVLAGAKTPKAEDKVALFATTPEDGDARSAPAFHAAAVTLDLACAAAAADGEISAHELLMLTRQIDSWEHLSPAHRKRLKAHLRLSSSVPPTVASLKRKFEPVGIEARGKIGRFLAHLAHADGVVSPEEVKFLERTYKALGLEPGQVFADLHVIPVGTPPVPTKSAPAVTAAVPETVAGVQLDTARIAQLQKETAEVSALLADVFVEDAEPTSLAEPAMEETEEPATGGLLGLDAGHSAFLRALISRRQWSREELEDIASDMELMLDGALEHINEASLDAFDEQLTEGDNPIEINHEILENIPA